MRTLTIIIFMDKPFKDVSPAYDGFSVLFCSDVIDFSLTTRALLNAIFFYLFICLNNYLNDKSKHI